MRRWGLRWRVSLMITCVLIAITLVGCIRQNQPLTHASATFDVSGVVRDATTKDPIVGATVDINGRTAATNGDGEYGLMNVPLIDGRATYTVTAPGYTDHHVSEPITPGTVLWREINLWPTSSQGSRTLVGSINFAVPPFQTGLSCPVRSPLLTRNQSFHVDEPILPREVIVVLTHAPNLEAAQKLATTVGAKSYRISETIDRLLLEAPDGIDLATFITKLMALPEVLDAYPNEIVFNMALPVVPGDPCYAVQHHLHQIHAPLAWSMTTGDPSIVVAVLDSGVSADHPDLQANLLPGWNMLDRSDDVTDPSGHGTHVAGIIGALANNGTGGAGVAWNVSILPVKVTGARSGTIEAVAAGIRYATDQGANIINMSLGIPDDRREVREAVEYAAAHGVIMVAAAGNTNLGFTSTAYPARYDQVIGVGAVSAEDPLNLAYFSLQGPGLDLVAPGQNVWSTFEHRYRQMSGTSMATPVVSGVATLMLANGIPPSHVGEILRRTAIQIGDPYNTVGDLQSYGYGLVNAYGAVVGLDPRDAAVFVVSEAGQVVGSVTSPDEQRRFVVMQVPEGDNLQLAAWIDVNVSGALDTGDYIGVTKVRSDVGDATVNLNVYDGLGPLDDAVREAVRQLALR